MQSSTTADQENLPLANPPPACCIVSGGVCKIKTTLLLQYQPRVGIVAKVWAAFRGAAGLASSDQRLSPAPMQVLVRERRGCERSGPFDADGAGA
jgi:hypothetical protein